MATTLTLYDDKGKEVTLYTNKQGGTPGYNIKLIYTEAKRSGTTVTLTEVILKLTRNAGTDGTLNRIACKVGTGTSSTNVKNNATIRASQKGTENYSGSSMEIGLGNLVLGNHTSDKFQVNVLVASTGWSSGWDNFQGGSPVGGAFYVDVPPAHPTFTTQPSATNEEETSVTLNPGVTNMKSKFYYKLSSSSTWIEFSSSIQITGLSPGTAYTINVQARNEADTSLVTNATNVSVTTKKYPYILSITTGTSTSSRSNAGEQQTVKVYNPLKRDIILYMDHNSKGGTNIYTSSSFNGEEHSFTIPLDKAGKALGATGKTGNAIYHVKYGSQASATVTGYYQITEAYAKPVWSASLNVKNLIKYKDGNATSAGVTGSTDSAPILLQKYSTLYIGLNTASYGATAQHSAAISKYQISINSGSYVDYTGSKSATTGVQNMNHTVAASAISVSVKVRAVDGRGFISEVKELVIPVRTYTSPTGAARFERNGGYGTAATVTVSPTWGYPKPSGAEKATVITRQKGTTTTIETLSFTSLKTSASKAAAKAYNNNLVYECVATFTDAFGTASSAVIGTMIEGQPIFFIDSALQGVGVNCFPDEKGLKVEGSIAGGSGLSVAGTITGRGGLKVDHGLKYGRQNFTVDGDANTYYPVLITQSYGNTSFAYGTYHIYRGYAEQAPASWNTSTHKGGLTFSFYWSGDIGWGGNDHNLKVLELNENYCKMVGGITLSTSGLIVWLRGGTALYHIESDIGTAAAVKVCLDGYTDSAGTTYTSRAYSEDQTYAIHKMTLTHPYPVGSIYMSTNTTSPASFFGGKWERLKDRFLLGAGDTYTKLLGIGGSASSVSAHTHEISAFDVTSTEEPNHSHYIPNGPAPADSGNSPRFESWPWCGGNSRNHYTDGAGKHTHTVSIPKHNTVSTGTENGNMPPYLIVYMWKRIK